MLFRQRDFHGGRAYALDPPDKDKPRFRSHASAAIAWVKLQLRRLTPTASTHIVRGFPRRTGEGFSFLGSDERHAHVRGLDTKVFPMAHHRRDALKALGQVKPFE